MYSKELDMHFTAKVPSIAGHNITYMHKFGHTRGHINEFLDQNLDHYLALNILMLNFNAL